MVKAKTHAGLDGTEGRLRTRGNFGMRPSLKISQFDHQALFWGNSKESSSYLRTLDVAPCFIPNVGKSNGLFEFNFFQRGLLYN